jgi:phospholipid/cholesterol/gamma-HCH transport system permease protein
VKVIFAVCDFIGGITLLAWRVIKLIGKGGVNPSLLLQQMLLLGYNSIFIAILVLSFVGAVFTFVLADELNSRGAGNLAGGLLLLIMLRELLPLVTSIVLAGKIGASITSEIGTMRISEQLDALKALSTDPDWYLTTPRVLAGILMMPVIAIFAGYGGWYSGYYMAKITTGMAYATFRSQITVLVDYHDFLIGFVKCMVFGMVIVLTACLYGYRAHGGAAGVGKAVTESVTMNIVLIFALDLLVTAIMD